MSYRTDAAVNCLEIVGRVVNVFTKNDKKIMTVYSRNHMNDVYLYVELADEKAPLNHHQAVSIKAHVDGYWYEDKETGKRRNVQHFVADQISNARTCVESAFGVKGKFVEELALTYFIKGTLRGIKEDHGYQRLDIETLSGAQKKHSHVRVSMKTPERDIGVRVGDNICCVCDVNSKNREVNGKERHFEDILVRDIGKVG